MLQCALLVFGDTRTARLASISMAHLYHLRGAAGYQARRQQGTKTRSTGIDREPLWEIVATWRAALRGYLLPVIKAMLEAFPFTISGFHADNGSEYINHQVAGRLEKLRIELTKSRPRHSNANGLAETKNGAA